jgi:hypothetical protein
LPHEIETEGPPPEDTEVDFESIALLKEDIARFRRDHGGQ